MKVIQQKIKQFVEKYNLKTKPELRMLDVISEAGEVSKEILKMTQYGRQKATYRKEIELEIADLLFSVVCLATHYNIDVEKAIETILKKYEERLQKCTIGSEVD